MSLDHSPEDLAPASESLPALLRRSAAAYPGNPALLAPGRAPLSYGRLFELAESVTGQLRGLGIDRGDRVALVLPDGPEMAAAFLCIASATSCAPLNPSYRGSEFEYYLRDLKAQAVVIPAGSDSPALAAARVLGIRLLELYPVDTGEVGAFQLRGPGSGRTAAETCAAGADIALLLHTSGTTARPKLVPLSQANLCASARHIRATLRLAPQDRCINIMPLFHIHGLVGALLASLSAGASVVCAPGFQAARFLDWLDEFHPTWFTAVPTMLQSILARMEAAGRGRPCPELRLIRSSSASLAPSVMARLEAVFQVPVIESYGMTEASHQMASNPLPPRARKPGSVGPAAGPEIAVVDDAGNPAGEGQIGEVLIRGPNVTAGYDCNPRANSEAFRDGWFRTGDLGYLDADGYLFLSGRLKELINRGGEKISPREVEERLLEHPAVAQAVAFALPDERLGEDVAAAVILAPGGQVGEAELREFTFERLSHFKVPRRIVFVQEIPKGPTGKLQRIGLAERLQIRAETTPGEESGLKAEPRTAIEKDLAALFAALLGRPKVETGDHFFLLGGDSMMAAELLTQIESKFGRQVGILDLLAGPTVANLARILEDRAASSSASGVVPLQPHGPNPPLFCAQTLEGSLVPFANLARHLGNRQPVFGLRQPDLKGRDRVLSVEEMAEMHERALRTVRASGPFGLIGLCYGGQVVYEMARRLEAAGERVALLVMVDCINHARSASGRALGSSGWPIRLLLRRIGFAAAAAARQHPREGMRFLARKLSLFRLAWTRRIRRQILHFRQRHGRPVGRLLEDIPFHNYATSRDYVPGPYSGRLTLVRAEVPRAEDLDDACMGWGNLAAGGVDVTVLPGDHYGLMSGDNARAIAEIVDQGIREAQAKAP